MKTLAAKTMFDMARLRRLLAAAGPDGISNIEVCEKMGWNRSRTRHRLAELLARGETSCCEDRGGGRKRWVRVYVQPDDRTPIAMEPEIVELDDVERILPIKRRLVSCDAGAVPATGWVVMLRSLGAL